MSDSVSCLWEKSEEAEDEEDNEGQEEELSMTGGLWLCQTSQASLTLRLVFVLKVQHIVVQKTEQAQTRPTFYDLVLKDSCERTFYLADTYSLFWAASVVQVYL